MTNTPTPDLRLIAIEGGYRLAQYAITTWIENLGSKPKTDSQGAPSKHGEPGCTTCEIHKNVALANSYVQGCYRNLNPDGSVPAGLGGTLALARNHIDMAMGEIPQILGLNDRMDQALLELGKELPGLQIALINIDGRQEWDLVASRMQNAEILAYRVPEIMYRRSQPEVTPQSTPESSSDDATVHELSALVRKVREGELPPQEALEKLNEMFIREASNGKR